MRFPALILVFVLTLGLTAAQAASLPDTGQDQCDNGSNVLGPCLNSTTGDTATYPRQDGRFGRDAKAAAGTLIKFGGGAVGFDYTKVANNGSDLPASATLGANATDWACTRDNITGLIWEVQRIDGGLHDYRWTYSWYNTDANRNGGNWGLSGSGYFNCQTPGRCDTEKFAEDVNGAALCGYSDWRMPTRRELLTLVHAGAHSPSQSIDTNYFPNTATFDVAGSHIWSGTSAVMNIGNAWFVNFATGSTGFDVKAAPVHVFLVRGAEF